MVGVNPQPIYDDHPTRKIPEGYAMVEMNFPPSYDDHHTLKIIESIARVRVEPRLFTTTALPKNYFCVWVLSLQSN